MIHHLNDPLFWLSIAAMFVMLELLCVAGVGFLMIAISFLVMVPLSYFQLVTSETELLTVLGGSFVLCMLFLLMPLRRFYGMNKPKIHCFVGEQGEVIEGPISKSIAGKIRLKDYDLPAILSASDAVVQLEEGDLVRVVSVHGRLLCVTDCDS